MLKRAKASGLSDMSGPEVHCIHVENVTLEPIGCTLMKRKTK